MTLKTLRKGQLWPCLNCDRMRLVTTPSNHICWRCKNPVDTGSVLVLPADYSNRDWGRTIKLDPTDPRVGLVDRLVAYLRDTDQGQEIVKRWPFIWDGVAKIEHELDKLDHAQVRAKTNQLLKRLAYARGRRGHSTKSNKNAPYWHDFNKTGKENEQNKTNIQKGEENMAINLEVQDSKPIAEGQHRATISGIEEKESTFPDSKHKTYLLLTFSLPDGRSLAKGYTPVLSERSNLGRLWKRLKGPLPVGKTVDVELLIGEEVDLIVSHETDSDGGVRERITEVFKPLKSDEEQELEEALT